MIYSQPGCEHCQAAKAILNKQEIQYVDIDIARDPEAAKVMAARTGASTVPQIIIGSKHVGGAQELLELADSGALAELLTGAKA
ncbi:MAG: glutaredoxin [Ahrensia sp.]|nr:glutaredoxin [Ahrensia sp.]